MPVSDPRWAELEALLDSLEPRTEYVYRIALMAISEQCRGDRMFMQRTEALRVLLRLDEDEVAEVYVEARKLQERLAAELSMPP